MGKLGKIHSIETCGTVDGPGVRFVVFLQGCHLRCLYCHNVDTWSLKGGEEYTSTQIVTEALRYKSYLEASKGGITLTGGEPLLQAQFVAEVFALAKKSKLHTALDTSGHGNLKGAAMVLEHTDLVLLDLKTMDAKLHKELTGVELKKIIDFVTYINDRNIPTWIRHVIIPGYTDRLQLQRQLAQFIATLTCVERVEILPFHKMGEYKWSEMGYAYKLHHVPAPTAKEMARAYEIFRQFKLPFDS